MVNHGREGHVGRLHVYTPAHAVVDAVGLLEYLFQHEVGISALLQLSQIHFDGLYLGFHLHVVQVDHLQLASATDDGDFVVFQIDHLVRIFHDGRRVGSHEELVVADAHHQRAALARHEDGVGLTLVDQGDGIGPDDLVKGQLEGREQIEVVRHLYVFDELHQHFRVRIAQEADALLLQTLLQGSIVFNDSVVNEGQIARSRIMRMSIHLRGFTVRGPTGVGYSDVAGNVFIFDEAFQIGNPSLGFVHIQLSLRGYQCYPRAVVTSVLQSLQAFHEDRVSISLTDVAYYSTHNLMSFINICAKIQHSDVYPAKGLILFSPPTGKRSRRRAQTLIIHKSHGGGKRRSRYAIFATMEGPQASISALASVHMSAFVRPYAQPRAGIWTLKRD